MNSFLKLTCAASDHTWGHEQDPWKYGCPAYSVIMINEVLLCNL